MSVFVCLLQDRVRIRDEPFCLGGQQMLTGSFKDDIRPLVRVRVLDILAQGLLQRHTLDVI